jgi:hypothetical protein
VEDDSWCPTTSRVAQRAHRPLAGTLARKFGARVVLLHVTPLPPGMLPTTLIQPSDAVTQVTVSEFTTRAAAERLESWARPLRDEGVPVEVNALLGGIAEDQFSTRRSASPPT